MWWRSQEEAVAVPVVTGCSGSRRRPDFPSPDVSLFLSCNHFSTIVPYTFPMVVMYIYIYLYNFFGYFSLLQIPCSTMANFAIKKRLFLGLLLYIFRDVHSHTNLWINNVHTPFSAFWQVRRLLVCYRQVVIDDYFSVIFLSRFDWITQNEYFHFFFYSFQTFFPFSHPRRRCWWYSCVCVTKNARSHLITFPPFFFLNKKTAWLLRCPS